MAVIDKMELRGHYNYDTVVKFFDEIVEDDPNVEIVEHGNKVVGEHIIVIIVNNHTYIFVADSQELYTRQLVYEFCKFI